MVVNNLADEKEVSIPFLPNQSPVVFTEIFMEIIMDCSKPKPLIIRGSIRL